MPILTSKKHKNLATRTALSLAISLPLLAGSTAHAQTPLKSQKVERSNGVLEEIVVTSRKRGDEVLQNIPATITALSGDMLEKLGALNFDQFAYQVPGLTFNDEGSGQKRYVLRGIQSAGQQQVAVYYDEMPIPGVQSQSGDSGSQTTDLKLFDMERVEILKGPQGTTFGANSQAGAIRFITKKPNMERIEGHLKVGGSSIDHGDESYNIYGMINVPITDKLAVRAVAYYDDEGGYVDNVRLNNTDINWYETQGGRLAIRYDATPNLTIDAMGWIQDRDNGGPNRFTTYDSYSDSPTNLDFVDNNLQPLTDIRQITQFQTGDLKVGDYTKSEVPDDQEMYSLTINWDLGLASMVANAGYYERDYDYGRDSTWVILALGARPEAFPGDPTANRPDLIPALTDQTQNVEQRSFEVRFNSNYQSDLQWMLGAFYRKRESDFRSYVPVVNDRGAPINNPDPSGFILGAPGEGIQNCNPCVFARENERDIEEIAFFGELNYRITDQIEVMAGLRWFESKQQDHGIQVFPFALFPPSAFLPDPLQSSFKEDKFISKYQISYTPNDDLTFYALASQGYRLGGTNQQGVVDVPAGFTSDELWNYEIGAKTTWLDGRMTVNAAFYYVDWKDLQVSGADPTGAFNFIGNAGTAEIYGMELEIAAKPIDNFQFTAGLGWLPTRELTEDQVTDEVVAPGRDGDKLPFVPELTLNGTAQYDFNLPVEDWTGFVRGEYSFRDKTNSSLDTSSRFNRRMDSYSIFSVRAGLIDLAQDLDITLYVENVFDERGDLRVRTEDSLITFNWANKPRTIGIDISKRF